LCDVTAERIILKGSTVVLENARIRGGEVGLSATRSEVIATNVRIEADTPVRASRSRIDAAGVRLIGSKAAVTTQERAFLAFSVSRAESPLYTGPLHGTHRITANKPI
jgi:hypothetical protein